MNQLQRTQHVMLEILNTITCRGLPDSYRVG